MNRLFDSLEPAWRSPHYVSIDEDALLFVATDIADADFCIPAWRDEVFPEGDDDIFVEFIGVQHAIQFCFIDEATGQKFDAEYPRGSGKVWRGSYAMTACLKRALDEGVPILDPGFLGALTIEQVRKLFEPVNTPIPLLEERLACLSSVGWKLCLGKYKSFSQLFSASKFLLFNNGEGIVDQLLNDFWAYQDAHMWRGEHQLQFAKRAQLLPMIYHGRALASNGALPLIVDPEHFGPVCDYVVPNALRKLGVLRYVPSLHQKILEGKTLPQWSDEEIEIRALTARAVKLLLDEVNIHRRKGGKEPILIPHLDSYLWSNGRQESEFLHHKTYTIAY